MQWSEKILDPVPNIFYDIFLNYKNDKLLTTWRNILILITGIFSPNKNEFQFYISKKGSNKSHYCIARIFYKNSIKVMTILDLYGDFDDSLIIQDLLKLVLKDAIDQNVVKVTSLTALPRLNLIFKRCGFIFWKN